MAKTSRIRRTRHNTFRGLTRGSEGRRRLRHLDAWLERAGSAQPDEGGLAGSAAVNTITSFDAGANSATFNGHGLETGQQFVFAGSGTAPTGLTKMVAASGTFTFSGQPSAGDTVTIGHITYVFRATADETIPFEVTIGGSLTATLTNLAAAINGDIGGGAFSDVTPPHETVEATGSDATTVDVAARAFGTGGNSIGTSENGSNSSVGAATLTGGAGSHYYAIRIDANDFQFAASREDAGAGTAIAISDTGSGTLTFQLAEGADSILDMLRRGIKPETIEAGTDIDAV